MKPLTAVMILCLIVALLLMPGVGAVGPYTLVNTWGSHGSGDLQFTQPWGVAVDPAGYLYVADTFYYLDVTGNSRVEKYTLDGEYVTKWGSLGTGNGQFGLISPKGVVVDSSGNVLVSDPANGRIEKFDSEGNFLTAYDSWENGKKFGEVEQIAIDPAGNIFVDDCSNGIHKLDPNGNFLLHWGSGGSGDSQFAWPEGIAVDNLGNVYVADSYNHRIQKFDNSGHFMKKWGSYGSSDGQFNNPGQMAIGPDGNLYVVDRWNDRIQIFDSDGNFLNKIDNLQQGHRAYPYPEGIDLDPAGNVYISDTGNFRISKFSPGPVPLAGSISVTSNPAGAEIYLDAGKTGYTTPYTIPDVPTGSHSVYVTLAGYQMPSPVNAEVSAGETIPVDFTLVLIPPKPIPDFAADIKEGQAPLTVAFTDQSSGNPDSWAWYFGDESFSEQWTQMTPNAAWAGRYGQSAVAMPNGDIVLTGGSVAFPQSFNDVWKSGDNGATWSLVNANPGWIGKIGHSSVVLADGSIVIMSGDSGHGWPADVWRSVDEGATWTLMNDTPGWGARIAFPSVVMPDGSIVLMGGFGGSYTYPDDVWRSKDNGLTWSLVTAHAGWSPRAGHTAVAMPDGNIVVMGGNNINTHVVFNDVWRSSNGGKTWTQVNASAGWTPRGSLTSVVMPDGSIILTGGDDLSSHYYNDTWRSTDEGSTWTRVNENPGWSARSSLSAVAMPDGSVVIIAGGAGIPNKNDVWRLQPAGSSAKNPSHTYTRSGTYQVALQAYNDGGINSIRKSEYITVFAPDKGNIFVSSSPGGAKIFLDYTDTGHMTPYTLTNVPAGNHEVNVTKDCYLRSDPKNVLVVAGNTVPADFILTSDESCPPPTPAVTFNQPDTALCQFGCYNPEISAVISGLDTNQKVNLQLTYQILLPSTLQNEKKYVTLNNVGNGEYAITPQMFDVTCLWPGIPPESEWPANEEKVMEIHFGANLLDPDTGNCIAQPCTTGSQDYYWYPWVCGFPPGIPEFPSMAVPAAVLVGSIAVVIFFAKRKM